MRLMVRVIRRVMVRMRKVDGEDEEDGVMVGVMVRMRKMRLMVRMRKMGVMVRMMRRVMAKV